MSGWQDRAECIGTDPELFFPGRGDDTRAAKAICATCPVRAECLAYALDNDIKFGIFGGKSERERRRLRGGMRDRCRPLAPIDHGTTRGYLQHRRRHLEPCQACREAYIRRVVTDRQARKDDAA